MKHTNNFKVKKLLKFLIKYVNDIIEEIKKYSYRY